MQSLYASERGTFDNVRASTKALDNSLQQSYATLAFILYVITEVGQYARVEAHKRSKKRLPTKEDLNFNVKIASNTIIEAAQNSVKLRALIDKYKLSFLIEEDLVKALFKELIDKPFYTKYLETTKADIKSEQVVLIHLYNKVLCKNEDFTQLLEEHFPNWIDDHTQISFLVNQLLEKATPENFNKDLEQLKISEEDVEFALDLFRTVKSNDEEYTTLIEPKLQNWEMDRVASMDIILLRMALSELLEFPFIPKKVTINEYIEIAKVYSTPKSKDFINGIIDKLMKELDDAGKIKKKGRGLMN